MYVVDTDVISRTSPLSRQSHRVNDWLEQHRGQTFVSATTLAELQFGASRLQLRGATRQGRALAAWIGTVLSEHRGKVIALDAEVGRRAGEMLARAESAGVDPGFADACIAAAADMRGFEVVTFNARHFAAFGVPYRQPASRAAR